MFQLHVLGAARIEGKDGRLTGEPAQRHRLALLAMLSLARDSRLPRERLMALLWPDHGVKEARHLLNVSVHVLRKSLGDDVLRSQGDDLQLDTTNLSVDVLNFRQAIARGELAEAIAIYVDPLLDGFFLDGSPEFERWQDAERSRLDGELTAAMEGLAAKLEKAADWPAALQWWQSLSARSPDSARIALRLMKALEATGDRGGALRVADAHTAVLAKEFGAEPSPDVTALAARIRGQPVGREAQDARREDKHVIAGEADLSRDRHPGHVDDPTRDRHPGQASDQRAQSRDPASFAGQPAQAPRHRHKLAWALLTVAVVSTSGLAYTLGSRRTVDEASVAVLPFMDLSPNKDRAYLSDGLTEELLNALAKIPGLRVASRSSSFQFRDPGVDIREVGRRLGVAAVVEGSVRLDSNRLRVTAQLIETKNGYHLWSQEYDRGMEDVFAVQEDIARTVASALGDQLITKLPDTLVARGTESTEAYDLYLRGRHDWNSRTTEGMWSALRAFEHATTVDPAYASAYAGLSDTWQLLPDYGNVPARQGLARAKTAALRAIALDSTLAEAHASLGAILDDYDRDRRGAEQSYRRAIYLNPGYSTARQWLAIHLADDGRHDEAATEMERARRRDPQSRIINTAVGAIRYFARDYAGAIAEYRAVVDQAPDFALAWALMGRVFLVSGRVDSAVATLQRSVELSGGDPSYRSVYAAALSAAGKRDEALAVARLVKDATPDAYVPYCELASAYLYLGDDSTALALFERGFEERDPAIKHIKVEPLYDRIRDHPRFQILLERAGLR